MNIKFEKFAKDSIIKYNIEAKNAHYLVTGLYVDPKPQAL